MKNFTISDARDRLMEKGISPSIHRVKVLEFLMQSEDHPSVHTIYESLHAEIPTLSKTTIYNVINKFKENGLVQELRIEETEVRYEWMPEPHAHFKCTECDRIYNINYKCAMFKINEVDGHHIDQRQINFIGTCSECREKNNENKQIA